MIPGLDSAFPPSVASVQAARAGGVRVWSGYLQTRQRVGLYHAWTQGDFDVARQVGGTPIAYCSGWDDPLACQALAAAWKVKLCLDVEAGIRDNGPWVQDFLDHSGAGLYGNAPVFGGRRAAFYVLAAYPFSGDPGHETWPSWAPRPAGPCGWQWAGTHDEFGASVDSTWFDDSFLDTPHQEADEMPIALRDPSNGNIYLVDAAGKRHISAAEWAIWTGNRNLTAGDMSTADLDTIADVPSGGTGGGTAPTKVVLHLGDVQGELS